MAVDATLLEANAVLKNIRRRDNGDWKAYVTKLAAEAGLKGHTDAELRRFDKTRKNKKVSNADWQSPSDPDSPIAKMKDGTTHLAYKAEHVVDLDSNLVLSAEIHPADSATLPPSLTAAQLNLFRAGNPTKIKPSWLTMVATSVDASRLRRRGPADVHQDPKQSREHVWTDKPAAQQRAYRNNRRRLRGERIKRLQWRRSECGAASTSSGLSTSARRGGPARWLRRPLAVSSCAYDVPLSSAQKRRAIV